MESKQILGALNSRQPPIRACGPVQPDDHGDGDASHYANGFTRVQPPRYKAGTGGHLDTPAATQSTAFNVNPRVAGITSPSIRLDEPGWVSDCSEHRRIPTTTRLRAVLAAPARTSAPATPQQARAHEPSDLRG
jgi:hypothetical protein